MNDSEFKFLLEDRLQKIRQIALEYDLAHKGYITFSGGKDSTVLSYLVDLALPLNQIPRIYSNTAIDFLAIQRFVKECAAKDSRIFIIQPENDLKKLFSEIGFPFKSKYHSHVVDVYQRNGMTEGVKKYAFPERNTPHSCPKILQYQFTEGLPFRVSEKCCYKLKKEPFKKYEEKSGRTIGLTGMRRAEKGLREQLKCLAFEKGELHRFHPLAPLPDEWISEFIKRYNVQLALLYYPPYNFERTGCVGCPYNIHLAEELETLEKLLPNERKKCEYLWRTVYNEYRKRSYRLKSPE